MRLLRVLTGMVLCTLTMMIAIMRPAVAASPEPIYHSLADLTGKRFAYVNGSVYNLRVQEQIENTSEEFFPSLAECVAAVEAGKADAAVQLSYCCRLAINRRPGRVALLPEPIAEVSEGFFFPKGSKLRNQFNDVLKKLSEDGTLKELEEKWVAADDSGKTLPEQDWDAPNGTLDFATSGVIEPFSYVGKKGKPMGYDVEVALLIAKELGYHLDVSTIPMDSIFAAVASGKADFGGTLTETPERASACDFSTTVMPTTISVIVAAEESEEATQVLEYTSLDELDGKKIGVLNGAILDQLVQENMGGTYEFSYYNNVSDMVAALQASKIDAFSLDEPLALLAVNQNEGIGVMPEDITENLTGFFFMKGSPLVEEFNQVIESMWSDGTFDALKEKWTGSDDSVKTLPEQDWDTTRGELCMATGAVGEPMTYLSNGEVVGYDIEVAMLICKELGYGLTTQSLDINGIIAGVATGKYDFGGGSVSITEERKKTLDFTEPDYKGSIVMVVRTVEANTPATASLPEELASSFHKTFIEESRWMLIAAGLGVTILISVCSGVLGTFLGLLAVLARRSGKAWLIKVVDAYQALMGGVPLVVVLMVLFYVVFGAVDIAGEVVAIIAFTLAFGSTSGSTMWTAVSGIDSIQEECGLALGYTSRDAFKKIVFPQAAQQFLPQLMGQFVSLVKDTSIVGYIAVQDLTRASDLIRARTMDAFFPLISTAIIYFLFCRFLARVLERLARRVDTANRQRTIEGITL